ncbi:general stress protein [Heyndrickxia coagulans]|uniref:general stress protein n=1 Tax=Heyndrickxia coagulans TaxID=1398 RepID=UPI002E20A82C|nr:general stress protein [Heyndrickxia coagulans]
MHKIEVVENGLEATNKITEFENEGFSKDNIYIFSHDKNRSKDLTDATETGSVGMEEQGVVDSIGNLLRERGDELRSKMQALGLSEMEAVHYEKVLDEGRVVVIATDNQEEPEHLL